MEATKPVQRDYRQIYKLLVKLAGVDPDDEASFVDHFTGTYPGNEWRLGKIGSKYYRGNDYSCGRVDCYPEDYTDEKCVLLMHINRYLDMMATFGYGSAAQIVKDVILPPGIKNGQ